MTYLIFFVLIEIIIAAVLNHFYDYNPTLLSLNKNTTMYPGNPSNRDIPARKTKALEFKKIGKREGIINATQIIPAVNISEIATEYIIVMATPGLQRKDFSIEIAQSVITISAKRETVPVNCVNDRCEYNYTDWTRAFALPSDADALLAHAEYQNGELLIHIPRGGTNEKQTKNFIYVY